MNIVQIGTNRANDDVTPIVYQNREKLNKFIAVEPLTVHHHIIKECYAQISQLIIEGVAISPEKTSNKLNFYYHVDDGPAYEVASTNKEHILKHVVCNPKLIAEGIVELSVDCLTLNELFKKHQLIVIDLLYIDAEGLDFELIKSINFNEFDIRKIVYEHVHIDQEAAIHFLDMKGYEPIRNYGHNGWSTAAIKRYTGKEYSLNDLVLAYNKGFNSGIDFIKSLK